MLEVVVDSTPAGLETAAAGCGGGGGGVESCCGYYCERTWLIERSDLEHRYKDGPALLSSSW